MINVKFANASQAGKIHKHKKTKNNIFNCKANIFCNKICITRGFILKFFSIRVIYTSEKAKCRKKKFRIVGLQAQINYIRCSSVSS